MRTSKAFATISYNTTDFLKLKLGELVERGVLDFWAFVDHLPEIDEKKAHKHLFCVPSKLFECSTLIEYLKEIDLNNPNEKPLTCIACRSSKFGDWFLYCCHDSAYLASKGQSRKYHYDLDDFVVSDEDYFNELRHQIDMSKLNRMQRLVEAVYNGETFQSLVASGQIPIPLISQYSTAFYMLVDEITCRNGRKGHEDSEIEE